MSEKCETDEEYEIKERAKASPEMLSWQRTGGKAWDRCIHKWKKVDRDSRNKHEGYVLKARNFRKMCLFSKEWTSKVSTLVSLQFDSQ